MNNLRNIRKARGYSVNQLSKKTGLPLRTIEDWDLEKRLITSYHRIKLLAEVLECSMDDLMTKEEKCVYDGNKSVICLTQKENGVHIEVFIGEFQDGDYYGNAAFETIIPRKKALELLSYMKDHEDIKPFFAELEHK